MHREVDLTLTIDAPDAGQAALSVVAERLPDVPTAGLRRLFREGAVTVGGRPCGLERLLGAGDELRVQGEADAIDPAPLAGFEVLHDEPDVLACAKPAGVVVETERGSDERPFKGAVLHHLRASRGEPVPRPRVVHRLDRDTSGVVLVATTRRGLVELTRQFEAREVEKQYLALVAGCPVEAAGVVDVPLADPAGPAAGRGPGEAPGAGAGAAPGYRAAVTRWEVAERFGRHALLRVRPETGRWHQVRLHLASIGHPLAVDPEHGGGAELLLSRLKRGYRPPRGQEERPLLSRLSLHAERVAFRSPASGARVEVHAPLPRDLEVALKQVRRWDRPR